MFFFWNPERIFFENIEFTFFRSVRRKQLFFIKTISIPHLGIYVAVERITVIIQFNAIELGVMNFIKLIFISQCNTSETEIYEFSVFILRLRNIIWFNLELSINLLLGCNILVMCGHFLSQQFSEWTLVAQNLHSRKVFISTFI